MRRHLMVSLGVEVRPHRIAVAEQALADLHQARWPDQARGIGWDQGTELRWLQELAASWETFDWRPVEREVNACEHYRVQAGGLGIHVLVRQGAGPDRCCSLTDGRARSWNTST
jgi:hypothetical protein